MEMANGADPRQLEAIASSSNVILTAIISIADDRADAFVGLEKLHNDMRRNLGQVYDLMEEHSESQPN
jgi:hypothetical protein